MSAEQPAEIITGKGSSNMFYTFAEQVRALALLRAVHKRGAPKQWDEKASEHEIEAAAIELCHAYRPVRKQFDAFINDILVAIVNSLQPKSERFSPPQSTRLAITPPVLFVEEFADITFSRIAVTPDQIGACPFTMSYVQSIATHRAGHLTLRLASNLESQDQSVNEAKLGISDHVWTLDQLISLF